MKTLDRISQLALVAAFSLFIAAALLLTWRTREKTFSFYENRDLAEFPAFSAEAISTSKWFYLFETYLIDHAAGHNTLSRLDASVDLLLGRPVVNDVVVLPDLLLPYLDFEVVDDAEIDAAAAEMTERLVSVRDRVEANGGTFCYVAIPSQYVYYAERYPAYLNSRSEYMRLAREHLFRRLDASGVGYVDMLEVFDALGHPPEFFSTVDHHFSILGAYETYRAMLERLGVEALRREDFDLEEVPIPYLGSRARKLLGLRASDERLYTMTPKTPVPFTRSDWGSLPSEQVYFPNATEEGWMTYALYMGGDRTHTVVDTHRSELPSILIYGDSFTNAIECLAYASFDRMYSLDLRYYNGEKTLGDFIDELRPDYVVCIRDYGVMLATSGNGAGAGS